MHLSTRSLPTMTVAGAALLVVLNASAPAGVHQQPALPQAAATPTPLASKTSVRMPMSGTTGSQDHLRVVVIGDSLSTGLGTSPKQAWPKLLQSAPLPDKRSLKITNAAENGSGYLATGADGDTFRMEVEAAVTPATDVIMFFGSDNDTGADPEELKAAVASTFDAASARAPKAILVAIGPLSGSEEMDQVLSDVCSSEASAAGNVGVKFIDPIADRWLGGRADVLLGPDGEHPSAKGQKFLRDKMRRILTSALAS
ncbi:SGNH/GDSL hydrolase family protein [Pseudarthrobacter sp. NPDC080039]|uniref:SGNH/GDSL hydrolase family protein n=1 Tax=unclassified Pseudarthrobacter TaxID=2647000 RepID=UPI003450D935